MQQVIQVLLPILKVFLVLAVIRNIAKDASRILPKFVEALWRNFLGTLENDVLCVSDAGGELDSYPCLQDFPH